MQKIKKSPQGFSLVELSVVLIIIGILITGISSGSHLVRNSRIASARSMTLSSQIVSMPGMVAWFENSTRESFELAQTVDGAQVDAWFNREPSVFLLKNNLSVDDPNTFPLPIETASSNVVYRDKSINNIPALNMTVAGRMALASFSGGALERSTVVIVFRPTGIPSGTATTIFDAGVSGNATVSIGIKNDRVILDAGSGGTNTLTTPNGATFTQGGSYILIVYFNGSSSKVFVNHLNEIGSTFSSCVISANGTIDPGANFLDGITIGANKSGASGIAAEIPEVIVFNRILKDSERQDVLSYLSKKYRINVTCI